MSSLFVLPETLLRRAKTGMPISRDNPPSTQPNTTQHCPRT
ncbi:MULTISPECIES: hypothetical protein [Cysteiniphilum]|nr:hypothetical protein [Cysteiniphilum marinum]